MRESIRDLRHSMMSRPILAIAILFLLVIFSTSVFLFFSNEKAKLVDKTLSELKTINNYKAHLIDLWLEEREGDVEFISNIHLMHKEFLLLSKDPNNSQLKLDIANHFSFLKDAYKYENILAYDNKGNLIFSINPKSSNISDESLKFIKSNPKSKFISKCYFTDDNYSFFDFVFPINYTENEVNVDANIYIVFKLSPSLFLNNTINSWPVKTETAESILYEKNNESIYNILSLKNKDAKPNKINLKLTDKSILIIQAIVDNRTSGEGIDYKKREVFYNVSKIEKLDWYLVTKIEKNEVFAEFNYRMYLTLGVIALLFFSAVLILLFIRKNEKNSLYVDLYKNEVILRLKNEIFKTTFYSIGDGVITTDANGVITQMNHVAEDLTGWKELEAIGQRLENVYSIYNETTGEEIVSPVTKVLHTGEIYKISNSTIIVSKKGTKTPVSNIGAPIKNEKNELIGVVLVIKDQTDETIAKNILIESELYANEILNKLNEAQSIAKIGSMEIDLTKDKVWWSNEVYNIFEEPKDFQPDINSSYKYLKEETVNIYRDKISAAIAKKENFEINEIIVTAKGNIKYCRVVGKAIYNHNDAPIKLVSSIVDVSEKMQYEKQLRKLETAVMQSPASIVITDLLGRIEFVNPKFEELTGYTSEEAIKNNPRILKSGNKTKEEYIELWDTITSGKTWSGEFLNIKKNKEEYWESARIAPIFDENGTIINFIGIKVDITDKKIADKLLVENEQKFRSYIENAPIGIFITDSNGIVSEINKVAADLAGLEIKDAIGFGFDKFLDDEYKNDVFLKYSNLQIGDSYSLELPVYDINKNKKWVIIHTSHLADNVYLSYALDINDIKKYQEELIAAKNEAEEMNRLKSSFLSNMSHELRTPMIGILGFAQLLEKEEDLKEVKEMSHLVYESGRRLMDTLNSILNLSKIESGSVKIQKDEFDLIPFLFEVTQIYKSVAKQNNIELKISHRDLKLNLITDKRMLTDIINNLLNNAVKFTEVGTITLTEEVIEIDKSSYVKIDVIDTGIGISEENIGFIFEEFRQGSEGIARRYEGSGLGLTVSRKYAMLLDGDLSVISEKGKGSTFTLIFPLRKQTKSIDDSKFEIDTNTPFIETKVEKPERKKLLYVEDDDISIQYLKRICPKNFEVFSTRNKVDALKILEANNIDMILMDINLGEDENGIDITHAIKEITKFQHIPIAACTAYAMHGDRENFIEKGCDDYISKPFEKSSLINLLEKWTN